MESASIRKCLLSKEVMPTYEKHSSKEAGMKMKMYGPRIMISSGPPKYAISIISL